MSELRILAEQYARGVHGPLRKELYLMGVPEEQVEVVNNLIIDTVGATGASPTFLLEQLRILMRYSAVDWVKYQDIEKQLALSVRR